MCVLQNIHAQQIQVSADAQVTLAPGTTLSANGLKLTPTASLNLNGLTIQTNTTVTHPFGNTYVSRVYLLSPGTPVFSGDIQFSYLDGELNGLEKSSLQLIAWNGTAWQMAGTSISDVGNNSVIATGISNLSLNEFTLAANLALPLQWGAVSARRQQDARVKIQWSTEQEQNVSHFDVERSTDGLQWIKAIAGIPARNQYHTLYYEQTDVPNHAGQLYYRIRQTDHDDRYTLSKVVIVAAVSDIGQMAIYPNPANTYFIISGVDAATIDQVSLFSAGGIKMQTWRGNQIRYNLTPLPPGAYYIQMQMKNGEMISRPLTIL
jgi:hypothetical protein